MAVDNKSNKYLVLMCTFCLCCVMCQLNLSEDSPCTTNKKYNGTCVRLFRCGSAVLTYLYNNAGFLGDESIPLLPDICSHKNEEPVVCCTDCVFTENDEFKDSAIAPYGVLVSRRGPIAWKKCLDYFQRLPYPCRGKGNVNINRSWKQEEQCHNVTLKVILAVGGQHSQSWKFPHQALLGYGDKIDTAQWLCEGTVISERFILTAAHCTNAGIFGTIAYAALGLQNKVNPEKPWNIYDIKRIIVHPEFNEPSWYHDIALLETETEIRFDHDILPACLDVGIQDISMASAAGIRSQVKYKTQSENLHVVYLKELNKMECANAYNADNNLIHGYDHTTQMCYGTSNNTYDTCKRISGSPLQIDQFECQYTVVGVTSYAKECGRTELPDIYTRIRQYLPWIERIVWPEED